jgi:RHS repeat-associated protein
LISVSKPGMTASFTYDGDGNRVEKNVNGTQTRYMVDGNNLTGYAQVVEELDAANTVQVVYTYGLDLISQSRKGLLSWTTSYYGYDATGSTRMLFDESGTRTDSYTYEAFGTIIKRTGTTKNAYLFHGEQYDADLGLYYLRARYMDNNVGRFVTMDGFEGNNEDPRSLHKYSFANNNPNVFSDPSGESAWGIVIGLALLIGIAAFVWVKLAKKSIAYNVTVADEAQRPNDNSMRLAQELANTLRRNIVITSGYRPGANGAHGESNGNAFDLGVNNNPGLTLQEVRDAYARVFDTARTMALHETTCFHFQLRPGTGNATGFRPGLRDSTGAVVGPD